MQLSRWGDVRSELGPLTSSGMCGRLCTAPCAAGTRHLCYLSWETSPLSKHIETEFTLALANHLSVRPVRTQAAASRVSRPIPRNPPRLCPLKIPPRLNHTYTEPEENITRDPTCAPNVFVKQCFAQNEPHELRFGREPLQRSQ